MEVRCLLVFLVIFSVECKKTYRVGVFENDMKIMKIQQYEDRIRQSATENLDILVLPPPEVSNGLAEHSDFGPQNYEKNINIISKIAKQSSMYVAAHLFGEIDEELAKVNVVFDRNGTVIATYIKPQTTATYEIGIFTSSFGVLFGILQEEDLFQHNIGALKNVKNFIVMGASDRSFKAANLASFFAHVTKANFITSNQIFGSANIQSNSPYKLVVADLYKNGADSCSLKPLDTTLASHTNSSESESSKEYISVEKFTEIFDYIWIKVRIIVFIVSIYILEMM